MRALLLYNPNATTTNAKVRDGVINLLGAELDLHVQPTKQRGHSIHLAAGAVHEGVDVLFALGGDGTANEVVQGLVGSDVLLGIIPGGSTNVLARALGLPNDPLDATRQMLGALLEGRSRSIGLGLANDRYFTFQAGFGFDAAVVAEVERHPRLRRLVNVPTFVTLALAEWFRGGTTDDTPVIVELPGAEPRPGYTVTIIGNTDPYTYLGPLPMRVTPNASFDRGLDLLAVRTRSTTQILDIVRRVFTNQSHVRHEHVDLWEDLSGFTLRADRRLPLMVDGDYAGDVEEVVFRAVPDAIRVLA